MQPVSHRHACSFRSLSLEWAPGQPSSQMLKRLSDICMSTKHSPLTRHRLMDDHRLLAEAAHLHKSSDGLTAGWVVG